MEKQGVARMKTFNRGVKEALMHVLNEEGLSILWDVDAFEEKINSYSLDYYEECYEMTEALKAGLFDTLILNRHIPFADHIAMLRDYLEIDENEAVFMLALSKEIVNDIDWDIEIVNLENVLKYAKENEKIRDLHIAALAYYDGVGVPQDYETAYHLFEDLEYMGDDEAYYYLGMMNEEGKGVEMNREKAIHYYQQGASLNENECFYALGRLYLEDGNSEEAVRELSESEDPRSYGLLGTILEDQNAFHDAFLHYVKGAQAYDSLALYRLGRLYQEGLGVTQNLDEALKYYSYAYYQANEEATLALAHMYALGEGVPVNAKFAHDLYEQYHESVGNENESL